MSSYVPITTRISRYASGRAKQIVLTLDILAFPAIWALKWLSAIMLTTHIPCEWTKWGFRCGTCGGTHCVNAFASGNLATAFSYNPFVFASLWYGIVSILLLNAAVLCRAQWAKKALHKMYSLTMFFVAIGLYVLFIVLRNVFSV